MQSTVTYPSRPTNGPAACLLAISASVALLSKLPRSPARESRHHRCLDGIARAGSIVRLGRWSIVAALKARSSRLDVVGSPAESCSQCLALPSPAGAALPPDHATEGRSGDGVGRRPCPHRTGSAGGAWAAPRFIATAASKILVKDDLDKQCRRTRRVGSATRPASHRDRGDTPLQTQCKEVTPPFHFSQISP